MSDRIQGKVLAIAVKSADDGEMHLLEEAEITIAAGVANDPRGSKNPNRQVTIVSSERAVCSRSFSTSAAPHAIPRTVAPIVSKPIIHVFFIFI